MQMPSYEEQVAFIIAKAQELGIDPQVALAVARSEGLQPGTWQAKGKLSYGREQSYGPYQLHVAPPGHEPGLGNEFKDQTGLDPADPANWQASTTFGLQKAKERGWSPWFGAKKIGITGKEGIGGNPYSFQNDQPSASAGGTSMGGFAQGPGAVQGRMEMDGLLGSSDSTSVSPSQEPGFDFGQLKKAGKAFSQLAEYGAEDPIQAPAPLPPLMPLRRITLGQGLLG